MKIYRADSRDIRSIFSRYAFFTEDACSTVNPND